MEYYDLSQIPPVLRTLYKNQIVSVERDEKWRHPPALANYTSQELADVIAFLKFAATGTPQDIAGCRHRPHLVGCRTRGFCLSLGLVFNRG